MGGHELMKKRTKISKILQIVLSLALFAQPLISSVAMEGDQGNGSEEVYIDVGDTLNYETNNYQQEAHEHEPNYDDEDEWEALENTDDKSNQTESETNPELEYALENADDDYIDEQIEENGFAYIGGWIIMDSQGNELPQGRTVQNRVRSLGYPMSHATYDFGHLSAWTSGAGFWEVDRWQAWHNGAWRTAFCTQPGIPSVTSGNWDDWNQNRPNGSAFNQLSTTQRNTINYILLHGYGNIHGFSNDTSDNAFMATQIAIWEVILGAWTWQTTWNPNTYLNNSNTVWDMNRRLIQPSGQMVGGVGSARRSAIGNGTRQGMYNQIRQDINDFRRLGLLPSFAFATASQASTNANTHTLTWNSTRNRYEVTLSDGESANGNQVLNRFTNLTNGGPSVSFGSGTGLRVERINNNTLRIYATSTTNPNTDRHISPPSLLAMGHSTSIPVVWFHHPVLQDKVAGFDEPLQVFFAVQVQPRTRATASVLKTSSLTGQPLPHAEFRLRIRNTADTAWRAPNGGSEYIVTAGLSKGEGRVVSDHDGRVAIGNLLVGRTYELCEITPPPGYSLATNNCWTFTTSPGSVHNHTFVNAPLLVRAQVRKYSDATNQPIPGTIFRLQVRNNTNTDWVTPGVDGTAVVSTVSNSGILSASEIESLPGNNTGLFVYTANSGERTFTGLEPGRRYRIQEVFVPAPHVLGGYNVNDHTWFEFTAARRPNNDDVTIISPGNILTQYNHLTRGRVRINKLGRHIVGFEDDIYQGDLTPEGEVVASLLNWFRERLSSDTNTTTVGDITNPPHLQDTLTPTSQAGVRWIFEDLPIEGVGFNIYARNNIVLPNGTIAHAENAFVGRYYTDAEGFIESGNLHLGNYFIREISAPNGWYIHDVEIDFSLVYKDQYTAIVFADIEIENEWMIPSISLVKVGEMFDGHLDFSDTFTYLEGVHFGLFAGENFEFAGGQVMETGTLIEDGFTDSYGRLQFNRALPVGRFYVQEIAVADHYVVDDTKHFFEHTGDVQDAPHIEIQVDGLDMIPNYFVRGSFEIIKVSRDLPYVPSPPEADKVAIESYNFDDNDFEDIDLDELETLTPEVDITEPFLAGVEFELWNLDLDEYVATFVTDEYGHIFVEGLIFGNYRLTEIKTDSRHQLNTDPIYFTIDREHQEHSWIVVNYKTNTNILKVDDLGYPLAGAHFQVIEVATGVVVEEWMSTEEPHVILGLNHGEHILRETEAPAGFLLGGDIHFTVTDSQETIYIVAENALDNHVKIGTQAHTGDGSNQYFMPGDTVNMHDDIRITHYNIRPGSPMAFEAFLHARTLNGDTEVIWRSGLITYTVENVLEFNVNTPNESFFMVHTEVDTSKFPDGTEFFWSESLYREIPSDGENDYEHELIYEHNKDGSDTNQTLFPRERLLEQLPRTGAHVGSVLWIGFGILTIGISSVVYKKKYDK